MLKLSQALRISTGQSVAFVGAGGKTSAVFQTALELAPVIVTTSTHIGSWQAKKADRHFLWLPEEAIPEFEDQLGSGITLITGPLDPITDRFRGLKESQLEKLNALAGYHDVCLLIEADGSRQIELKAPGENEPAIPGFVDVVVVVAGLTGLGKKLSADHVHRYENFAGLSGLEVGENITAVALAKVLSHPKGGLKNIPTTARRVALLNQADKPVLQAQAGEIGRMIQPVFDAVVISALEPHPCSIFAVKEKIAAIILAGVSSSHFGPPIQLLSYNQKTIVRIVAETALHSELSPVIVVCGTEVNVLSAELVDLPVRIIENVDWLSGQGSSIKAGMGNIDAGIGGVIIMMDNQPQVSVELLRALVERHSQDLPAILAPYVFDQRTHPFIYDKKTFNDLREISNGKDGRELFSKFSPRYLNWYDRSLLLEVEFPQDF